MRQIHGRVVAESYEHELDLVACPVTLVWGDDDVTAPLVIAERALERLRRGPVADRAELIVVPGAGHLVPLTAPGRLRAAVERYLR